MATLSAVLTELVYNIVKNIPSDDTNCQYLSLRMKTYHAHLMTHEDLLCHVRVASSYNLPVVVLLREQKLKYLADFLLDVQRDDEDCHCVVVNSSSCLDPAHSALTSRLSLTVRRQQGHDENVMSCGDVQQHAGYEDTGSHVKKKYKFSVEDYGKGTNNNSHGTVCEKGVMVECEDLGQTCTPSIEYDTLVTSLHLRFHTNKITMLREGKLTHDFLRALKLFQPSMDISFALNIEGQKSGANFRFQDCTKIEGQPVITDPRYFSSSHQQLQESAGGSEATLLHGHTGLVVVGASQRWPHVCILEKAGLYATMSEYVASPAMSRLVNLPQSLMHFKARCHTYGPFGIPFMNGGLDTSAMTAWSSEVDWKRFGLAAIIPTSKQPVFARSGTTGEEEGSFRLAVTDDSLLPSWAASNHFVLAINFCFSVSDTSLTMSAVGQCVRDCIQDAGRCFLGDAATAALIQLYLPCRSAAIQEQQNETSSRLDILLPMMTESIAEIYTRSHNLHFRQNMEQLTKEDSSKRIESVLRQKLHSILEPPTSFTLSAIPPRPDLDSAVQGFSQDTQTSLSAHFLKTSPQETASLELETFPGTASLNEFQRVPDFEAGDTLFAEVRETRAPDEYEFTSQEEESWFSQMENELAL